MKLSIRGPVTAIFVLVLLIAPTIVHAERASVTITAGWLEYRSAAGEVIVIAAGADSRSPALSPDLKSIAYIKIIKPQDADHDGVAELWIADGPSGRTHRLFGSRPSHDPQANMRWFYHPIFSLDGGFVYVAASAWAVESAVHQIDVRTGNERFVVDGDLDSVMRSGPYRGYLWWRATRPGHRREPDFIIRFTSSGRMGRSSCGCRIWKRTTVNRILSIGWLLAAGRRGEW